MTSVTVVGADRVAATLHALADDMRDLTVPHRQAGAEIVTAAAQNVWRRTGALSASITATIAANGPTITAGNAGVRYAGPIEGGWRRHGIEPQRYMARALTSRAGAAVNHYVEHIATAARHVKGA